MNNHSKYTTEQKERKAFAVVMALIVLALIALLVLEVCGVFEESPWQPVTEFPMANAHITWSQTFYGGSMAGGL